MKNSQNTDIVTFFGGGADSKPTPVRVLGNRKFFNDKNFVMADDDNCHYKEGAARRSNPIHNDAIATLPLVARNDVKDNSVITSKRSLRSNLNNNTSSLPEGVYVDANFTPRPCGERGEKAAFTLAEVLITLAIIGVVAAIALPNFVANIQERVRKEQLRTAKYKLTLATDKMKSLGLLENQYTTEEFISELQKHLKLAKVCSTSNIVDCWPSDSIQIPTKNGITTKSVNTLTTGQAISALGIGTKSTPTMGFVTLDGVSMIMTYSPKCTPLEASRTYSWSTIDNKPETNATTNCISAVIDINGGKGPNRLGKDVRTWNSILGYQRPGLQSISYSECQKLKNKLGINECHKMYNQERDDYWGGAVKACYDLGLHLPSPQTLALIAGARYGRTDITPYTVISSVQFAKTNWASFSWMNDSLSCEEIWKKGGFGASDQIICIDNGTSTNMDIGDNNSTITFNSLFWSASEGSSSWALCRYFSNYYSIWDRSYRYSPREPLCLGD